MCIQNMTVRELACTEDHRDLKIIPAELNRLTFLVESGQISKDGLMMTAWLLNAFNGRTSLYKG